jgi:hypothetical protein
MKSPITPEDAASAQNPLPPVPTTKILAISHFIGTPMTPAQRAQIMPKEVHDTVNAYLRYGRSKPNQHRPASALRRYCCKSR